MTRARFERATPSFGGWCSIQLSYRATTAVCIGWCESDRCSDAVPQRNANHETTPAAKQVCHAHLRNAPAAKQVRTAHLKNAPAAKQVRTAHLRKCAYSQASAHRALAKMCLQPSKCATRTCENVPTAKQVRHAHLR